MAGRVWRPRVTLGLTVASSRPFSTHQLAPGEKHLPRCLCSGSCQEHLLHATLTGQIVFPAAHRNTGNCWEQGGGGGGLESPDPWLLERAITAKP